MPSGIERGSKPDGNALPAKSGRIASASGERLVTTCLVVDDSAVIRKVAGLILQRMGLAVTEAEEAGRALAVCEARMPDLAIVDSLMPGTDGFELVRALRALPGGDRAKIVMTIIESDIATLARLRQAGADACLMKPFTPAMMREKLEELGFLAQSPAAA